MNFSKLGVKSIYETMPERIRIEPIKRFAGKDFYKCGNNVYVDNEKTNVLICSLCRNNPAKQKSMFFMSSGSKNDLTHTKSHFQNNHRTPIRSQLSFRKKAHIMYKNEAQEKLCFFLNIALKSYILNVTFNLKPVKANSQAQTSSFD